jgi:hypothetical protein
MSKFVLDEETLRDFQQGLEDLKKMNQDPADEVSRKRFEKKWENHDARELLELFMSLDAED